MLCSPYSSFAEVIRDVIISAGIGIIPGEEAILLYFLWPLFDMFSGFAMADGGDKDKVSSTVYRGKAILSSSFVFADIAVLIILHRRPGLGAVYAETRGHSPSLSEKTITRSRYRPQAHFHSSSSPSSFVSCDSLLLLRPPPTERASLCWNCKDVGFSLPSE